MRITKMKNTKRYLKQRMTTLQWTEIQSTISFLKLRKNYNECAPKKLIWTNEQYFQLNPQLQCWKKTWILLLVNCFPWNRLIIVPAIPDFIKPLNETFEQFMINYKSLMKSATSISIIVTFISTQCEVYMNANEFDTWY